MIVNEISLKKFLTYTNSVYELGEKINKLERVSTKNLKNDTKPKTKASTGAKMMMMSCFCYHRSINETITTTHDKHTSLKNFFNAREYIPKTHGLRDCIIDTNYQQLVDINWHVLNKAKLNKFFEKNLVDGLLVCAWDGVELGETCKDINCLPEREHKKEGLRKYIKYECAMNVGPRANIIIDTKQMTETEKVASKTGKLKAKTFGETTAFGEMAPEIVKKIGKTIDVNVYDALYLNSNVMNIVKELEQYFVIRLNDERKLIYKDAEGLFKNSKPVKEYEIVEITEEISVKYSKKAKHKDYNKVKYKNVERELTDKKLGERIFIGSKESIRKNSIKNTKTYEKVIKRVKVWDESNFEFAEYTDTVRVIKSVEDYWGGGEVKQQTLYIATNMLTHDVNTIIKIMHLRWNIENNGFRKLKQQYNLEHIFIGEYNAINYIFQIIILVSNLIELYFKIRLKESIKYTYIQLKKIFEMEINKTKGIGLSFGIP